MLFVLFVLLFDRLFLAFPCHDQSKGKKDEESKNIEHIGTLLIGSSSRKICCAICSELEPSIDFHTKHTPSNSDFLTLIAYQVNTLASDLLKAGDNSSIIPAVSNSHLLTDEESFDGLDVVLIFHTGTILKSDFSSRNIFSQIEKYLLTRPFHQPLSAICMTEIFSWIIPYSWKIPPCHHARHHGKTRLRSSS
jgi:hypothetical protein